MTLTQRKTRKASVDVDCCVCGIHSSFMDAFLFFAFLSWVLLRLSGRGKMSFNSMYRFPFLIDPLRGIKTKINQEMIQMP